MNIAIQTNEGSVSLAACFGMLWIDPNLIWNSTEHSNVTQIVLPANRIWKPTLALVNGISESLIIRIDEQMSVAVFCTGVVRMALAGQFHSTCELDLSNFPFDSHNCTIIIQNWDLRTDSTFTNFSLAKSFVVTDVYNDDGEMSLVSSSIATDVYCYETFYGCFSTLKVSLYYSRNPGYYYTTVIIPSFLLTSK